jgi:hypothetical protein
MHADNTDLGTIGSAAGTEPPVESVKRDHGYLGDPVRDFTGTTLFDAAGIDALNNNYTFLLTEAMDLLPKFLGGI